MSFMEGRKWLKLLYLMDIFSEYTDDEHMLTLPQIIEKLKAYGVDVERKTLYQDFEILRDFGFDIVGVQAQRNYYIGNRKFELLELKLLVDSVQSAKFITKKKSNALIKKLEGMVSKYEAQKLQRQVIISGRVKAMNESIYFNVDKLHEAISAGCQMGNKFETIMDEMEVIEILPVVYEGDDFPGYENIRLSYNQLEAIIRRQRATWIAALQNQKAVYLITDKAAGKLYVGSATALEKMLLQRWTDYVNNGHGGNEELKKIVSEKGFDYVKENFQYSILENYNARMDDNYIRRRETWWKETLCTKKWGYNDN